MINLIDINIAELLNSEDEIVWYLKDAINDKYSSTEYIIHVLEVASQALKLIRDRS